MVGKKKRGHPDIEEVLARPWCYYCERDFDDLKILISHQKAKHFKCDKCGRRLNTAGGLSVHMNQVHKETLTTVENALPNRQGLEVEIFGMEGIPEEIALAHNQRILQGFYQAEAERRAATGNPGPGASGNVGGQTKKPKFESPSELKKRLAEHKARKAEQAANGSGGNTPLEAQDSPMGQSPGAFNGSPYAPAQATYGSTQGAGFGSFSQEPFAQPAAAYPQPPYSGPPGAQFQPQYSPPPQYQNQSFPPGYQQPPQSFPGGQHYGAGSPPGSFSAYAPPSQSPPQLGSLPNRPPSLPPAPGLPQRPSFGAPPVPSYQMQQMHQSSPHPQQGGYGWNNQDQNSAMSSAYPPRSQYGDYPTNGASVDDIDELIRKAELGIPTKQSDAPPGAAQTPESRVTPAQGLEPEKAEVTEKKAKKEKPLKMKYTKEASPEEEVKIMPRYAFVPDGKAESLLVDVTTVPGAAGTVDE